MMLPPSEYKQRNKYVQLSQIIYEIKISTDLKLQVKFSRGLGTLSFHATLVGKLKTKTFDSWLASVAQDRRMLNLVPCCHFGFSTTDHSM